MLFCMMHVAKRKAQIQIRLHIPPDDFWSIAQFFPSSKREIAVATPLSVKEDPNVSFGGCFGWGFAESRKTLFYANSFVKYQRKMYVKQNFSSRVLYNTLLSFHDFVYTHFTEP